MLISHRIPSRAVRFMSAALGMVLLLACSNPSQVADIGKAQGKATGGGAPSGKPTDGNDSAGAADQTPAEVLELLKILTQGHQIFRETWFVATSEILKQKGLKKEEPGSPFRRIGGLIDQHRHGHWEAAKEEQCNAYRTRVVTSGDFKDATKPFTLSFVVHPSCQENDGLTDETWATFQWEANVTQADQRRMIATFWRAYLPQAFGKSLASRASMQGPNAVKPEATCEFNFDASQRVRKMDCKGLGQNITSESYFEFSSLVFQNPPFDAPKDIPSPDPKAKEGANLVKKGDKLSVLAAGTLYAMVDAEHWKAGDPTWKEIESIETPVPPIGKIVQKIELLSVNAQDAFDQMQKDAQTQEATAPAAPAPDSDANKADVPPADVGQNNQPPVPTEPVAHPEQLFGASAQAGVTLVPGGEPVPNEAPAQDQAAQGDEAMQQGDTLEDDLNRSGFSTLTPEQQAAKMQQLEQEQAQMPDGQEQELLQQESQQAMAPADSEPAPAAGTDSRAQAPAAPRAQTPRPPVMQPTHDPVTGGPIAGDDR